MDRRSKQKMAGALVVLGLGILPAMAQFQPGGFPGGFGGGPMMLGSSSPEMNKKLSTISTLREILRLKLTNQDIVSALPGLKTLRDDEKSLQSQSLEALDEEEKGLIAAQPGGQLPPDSGPKLQQLHEQYATKQETAWAALGKTLGAEKTDGIRSLVGQEAPRPFAAPRGVGGADNGPFPFGGLQPGAGPGPGAGGLPPFLRGDNRPRGGPGAPMPFLRGRVTLAELVEAMERKVAATK